MNKRNKGFTLIELLVVIAIIGILSAIVLASLNSARTKAQDAKVQSQLANMRAAAEIYYGSNGNAYAPTIGVSSCTASSTIFTNDASGMGGLVAGTIGDVGSSKVYCNANDVSWVVASELKTAGTFWCVDATGKSRSIGSLPTSGTVCP